MSLQIGRIDEAETQLEVEAIATGERGFQTASRGETEFGVAIIPAAGVVEIDIDESQFATGVWCPAATDAGEQVV